MGRNRMTRQTLLALLTAVSTLGCPGDLEPMVVKAAPVGEESSARVATTGLGFRLSDVDDRGEAAAERKVPEGTPLGEREAARLIGRLPELLEEADDELKFS